VAKITKNSLFPSKINLSGFEQKFCFAVKEGDKDLLDKLNTGLVIVNENGKYQKIFDKWFPFLKENTITFREFFFLSGSRINSHYFCYFFNIYNLF